MKIWIFNHYAVGPGSNGITRHFDLAKNLVSLGHDVTIFAASFNHQALKEERILSDKEMFKEENHEGVKFIWIKTIEYKQNNWRRVLNMFDYTLKSYLKGKNKNDNPDIVIGSLAHPLAAFVGQKIAKRKKALFYFEERDLWPQSLIDLGKMSERNPAIKFLAWLEKYLYKKADRIIVLFDKAHLYVESKKIPSKKIIYIPNGVDNKRLNQTVEVPTNILNIFDEIKDKKIAIYAGTLGLANNIDVILDAAKELEKINESLHFVLVGGGPELKRLKNRILIEKIGNVTFIPPVAKEYIYPILKKSDIGLLPLQDSPVFKWGISPNKLYDYLASKLPVILMCNLDDTPLEKYNAGKVIKKDFKNNLINYLSVLESDDLNLMGENGYEFVKNEHDWLVLAKKLEEVMIEDLKKRF